MVGSPSEADGSASKQMGLIVHILRMGIVSLGLVGGTRVSAVGD